MTNASATMEGVWIVREGVVSVFLTAAFAFFNEALYGSRDFTSFNARIWSVSIMGALKFSVVDEETEILSPLEFSIGRSEIRLFYQYSLPESYQKLMVSESYEVTVVQYHSDVRL